jgi:hypothetical protein
MKHRCFNSQVCKSSLSLHCCHTHGSACAAAGTARCRFAAVAAAGACHHTLSQPHAFIRTVCPLRPHALPTRPTTPTRKSEVGRRRDYRQPRSYKKAIPDKSPAKRRGGGACWPPFPPPPEAAPAPPPPPAAHRPDQSVSVAFTSGVGLGLPPPGPPQLIPGVLYSSCMIVRNTSGNRTRIGLSSPTRGCSASRTATARCLQRSSAGRYLTPSSSRRMMKGNCWLNGK